MTKLVYTLNERGEAGWEVPAGGSTPFAGWIPDDGDPASVTVTGGGALTFVGGQVNTLSDSGNGWQASLQAGLLAVNDQNLASMIGAPDVGFSSTPTGESCFSAHPDAGATVSLDAGALPIINLPTIDPGIAGALWNNAGTPAISAGFEPALLQSGTIAFPITITTGVNDEFVWNAGHQYQIPAGTYGDPGDLIVHGIYPAARVGSPGQTWQTDNPGWTIGDYGGIAITFTSPIAGGGAQFNGTTVNNGTHNALPTLALTNGQAASGGTGP